MIAPLLCDYDFKEKLHKGENWKLSLSEETSWSIFNAKMRKNSRLWKVPIAMDWKRFLFVWLTFTFPISNFPRVKWNNEKSKCKIDFFNIPPNSHEWFKQESFKIFILLWLWILIHLSNNYYTKCYGPY